MGCSFCEINCEIAVEDWCSDSALQQVPNTRHSMHMSAHLMDRSVHHTHQKHPCSFRTVTTGNNKRSRRLEIFVAKAQAKQDSLQLFSPSKVVSVLHHPYLNNQLYLEAQMMTR